MAGMEVKIDELTFEVTERVKGYLKQLIKLGGSDLHIKAEAPIRGRVEGEIRVLDKKPMSKTDALTLGKEMLRGRFPAFIEHKEIDLTFKLDDNYRFRVNMFFQKDGLSAVFRVIETKIKSVEELSLPPKLKDFVQFQRGLVLVTGMTGSGKSTTMAAIIDEINATQKKHILTIEDPIEFIHQDKDSMISQRSVGEDTKSFADALRAALREDPDVILVGEIRDTETVEIALHAAETGHLVISTMHTIDAQETINRMIGMFPTNEQQRIRVALSSVLRGIISQRLVKATNNKRVAAVEIFINTTRISELIRTNRDGEIRQAMEDGQNIYGTQTFDQALLELFKQDKISMDEALINSTTKEDLRLKIKDYLNESSSSTKTKEQREQEKLEGILTIKAEL